jgi:hypothetical protein
MSRKSFSFIDKIKSKSIDKLHTSHVSSSYQYIENFDNVSEDDCVKLDNLNREIYKKNMDLYESINKKIVHNNAMFKIDTPPIPPSEPNNHDKFINYKIKNVSKNVRHQSYAVFNLIQRGYKLVFDITENKQELEFEPHEAVELLQKIENNKIENIIKLTNVNIVKKNSHIFIPSAPSQTHEHYNYQPQLSTSAPSLYNFQDINNQYLQRTQNNSICLSPPATHFIVDNKNCQ